jgi:hypothetical protein
MLTNENKHTYLNTTDLTTRLEIRKVQGHMPITTGNQETIGPYAHYCTPLLPRKQETH